MIIVYNTFKKKEREQTRQQDIRPINKSLQKKSVINKSKCVYFLIIQIINLPFWTFHPHQPNCSLVSNVYWNLYVVNDSC